MNKHSIFWKYACLLMAIITLNGCVSVDSRVFSEKAATVSTQNLKGRFSTSPIYSTSSTKLGLIPPSTLQQIILNSSSDADWTDAAEVELESGVLTFRFEKQGQIVATKQFSAADGLQITDEGKLSISWGGGCQLGGHDSPTLGGCGHRTTTLFVNDRGELVFEDSASAFITIGILPFAMHTNWVAIFPKALPPSSGTPGHFAYPMSGMPITIVVPFIAGSSMDTMVRDLSKAMSKELGYPKIVIDNNSSADSVDIADRVARVTPDGYTLLFTNIDMETMPSLHPKLPFNMLEDFEYAGIVNDVPLVLIGRPTLPAKNITALKDWITQNRDRVKLGTPNSSSRLCGLMLQGALQTQMTFVSYKSVTSAMTALRNNDVDLLCVPITWTTYEIGAKKVRAFAVTAPQRLAEPPTFGSLPTSKFCIPSLVPCMVTSAFKDLPTMQESGFKDFDMRIWYGLYAPKGTPVEVMKIINKAMKGALKDPDFIRSEGALGAAIATDDRTDPAGHKKFLASEITKWDSLIKSTLNN
jgi:tripartite-type tricarboxylate transporter receptor subunit TctC